jgi:hypothetical protein
MSIIEFMRQERQQEQPTGEYISPSRLSLWLKCPLAFRHRYIENVLTGPTPSLFVGKVVHMCIAALYRLRALHVCTVDELPMLVADMWKQAAEIEPCYFCDDNEEEKCRYQVLDLVKTYLTATPIQDEMPLEVEKRYEIPLIDPKTGKTLGLPLVGIVDLVLQGDGGHVLVDFKTSATSSTNELSHELQMTAYSYLVRQALGQKESALEIRQLVKKKTPEVIVHRYPPRSDKHFDRFFAVVREFMRAQEVGIYNFRPSWTCSTMCEHYHACAC